MGNPLLEVSQEIVDENKKAAFRRSMAAAFVVIVFLLIQTVVFIKLLNRVDTLTAENHALNKITCEELLFNHRTQNERLHHSILENQSEIAAAINAVVLQTGIEGVKRIDVDLPPQVVVTQPDACEPEEEG